MLPYVHPRMMSGQRDLELLTLVPSRRLFSTLVRHISVLSCLIISSHRTPSRTSFRVTGEPLLFATAATSGTAVSMSPWAAVGTEGKASTVRHSIAQRARCFTASCGKHACTRVHCRVAERGSRAHVQCGDRTVHDEIRAGNDQFERESTIPLAENQARGYP